MMVRRTLHRGSRQLIGPVTSCCAREAHMISRVRFHRLAVVTIAVCLGGCATQRENITDAWLMHNVKDLVACWGPPERVLDVGSGNRVFVWSETRTMSTPSYATMAGGVMLDYTAALTVEFRGTRSFWVDSHGEIYRSAQRGRPFFAEGPGPCAQARSEGAVAARQTRTSAPNCTGASPTPL